VADKFDPDIRKKSSKMDQDNYDWMMIAAMIRTMFTVEAADDMLDDGSVDPDDGMEDELIMMPVPMIQMESRRLLGILILPLAVYRHVRTSVDPPVGDGYIEDEEIFRPRPFVVLLERNAAGRLIDVLMQGPDSPESLVDLLIRGFRLLRARLQRNQARRAAEIEMEQDVVEEADEIILENGVADDDDIDEEGDDDDIDEEGENPPEGPEEEEWRHPLEDW